MKFSNTEYRDIVFFYGRANGNSAAARRMYAEAYPERRLPNVYVFHSTFIRLGETGCVNRPIGSRRKSYASGGRGSEN